MSFAGQNPRARASTAAVCNTFVHNDGTMITRLLLERHIAEDGTVWYIIERIKNDATVEVGRRDDEVGSEQQHAKAIVRSTMRCSQFPELASHCPVALRWTPMPEYMQSASSSDADVPGRASLTLPVCVIEGDGKELQSLV